MWLAGQQVRQYQVGSSGATRLGVDSSNRVYGSAAVGAALQRIAGSARGSHVLEADLAAVRALPFHVREYEVITPDRHRLHRRVAGVQEIGRAHV